MADNKRFIVKTGLQAQDLYLESPNKTKNITVSMLDSGVISFNTSSNQVFTVAESGATTLGTITTGTWNGTIIAGQYGGTGVNNTGRTITLGGNISTANSFTTSGNFATTLTTTAATNVTLPTSGTLMTTGGSGATGTWSISVTGNANTVTNGVYTTGNQTIGGVKTFSANSVFNGNVGIGTASPLANLQVNAASGASSFRLSVADVSYSNLFASVSGVGLYSILASPLVFGTTNAERLRIDAGGNVGIGTDAPSAKLDVYDANIAIVKARVGSGGTGVASHRMAYGTNEFGLYVGPTNALVAYDYGAGMERMRIDAAGYVGIGTSSPAVDLDIGGNVAPTIRTLSTTNAVDARLVSFGGSATAVFGTFSNHPLAFFANNGERMRLHASGGMSIGNTSDPGAGNMAVSGNFYMPALTTEARAIEIGANRTGDGASLVDLISDTTYTDFGSRFYRGPGANGNTEINHRGTGFLSIVAQEAAAILFSTTSTERMRINANGNVGIGTSAPVQKLEVVGNIYINGTDAEGIIMNGGNGIVRASSGLSIRTGNSLEKIRIDAGGQVGIGINIPTAKLHVVGTARITEEVYGKVLFSTGGMILNSRVISNSYTVIANNNAMSTGPIEIANGVTITISDGARWVVM